ncbi:MAG: hypothetical protein PHU49_01465 [Syntrophorhabdaceae bacterium]|nr:hypothetical protein [Syntrophorhabdaceae bacterium]MDD5242660.1 hypothetical protein [Syntrophorhabdaceae bacterium]
MNITEVGERLFQTLKSNNWNTNIYDEDYPAHDEIYAYKKNDGPLGIFNHLEIFLFELDNNPSNVEIRLMFFADPRLVDKTKRVLGKKVKENDFFAFKDFCTRFFACAGVRASQQEMESSPRYHRSVRFEDEDLIPAYVVETVYWKEPEISAREVRENYGLPGNANCANCAHYKHTWDCLVLGGVGCEPWMHDNLNNAEWLDDIVCVHWALRPPLDGSVYEIEDGKVVTYTGASVERE